MVKLAMLGSGFIGRFYADSIQGLQSKDRIVSIYSRREEQTKKFAEDYGCDHFTSDMEESTAHPDVDILKGNKRINCFQIHTPLNRFRYFMLYFFAAVP
jgi:predicted dehydrogenase